MRSKIAVIMLALSLSAAMLWAVPANADTIYDTTPSWNGSNSITSYGTPDTTTYGETFIAPADNVFQDFTFYINPSGTLYSKAYVYAWSGGLSYGQGPGKATGSALYASPSSIVLAGNNGVFQPVTVNTGGITLTPGDAYVMFLTLSNPSDYAASNGNSSWGTVAHPSPNDGGGSFVWDNNGNNFSALTSSAWSTFENFGDLSFKAVFTRSSVPEPSTLILTLMGLLSLAIVAKKRFAKT